MKQRKGKAGSKKGNRYLTAITSETAVVADQAQTREGARYRRLSRRRGKAKAQVAFGNTQLKVCHALLSRPGTRYEDPGPTMASASWRTRPGGTGIGCRSRAGYAGCVPRALAGQLVARRPNIGRPRKLRV